MLFAGHLDTVPAQGNIPGHRADGAVHGLGATDMKAGLAVMIELARWIALDDPELAVDAAFLFFPREELPAGESALPEIFAATPLFDEVDLVLMMEPTDNTIQPGCLGNLNARVHFRGESAHSARPWQGVNAIELALEGLRAARGGRAAAGRDPGADLHRGAEPHADRGRDRVERHPRPRLGARELPLRAESQSRGGRGAPPEPRRRLAASSRSSPTRASGRVAAEAPLVQRLRAIGDFPVEPKQAWTPVAEFSARGLDAVNFGPGATRFAHRRDEQVPEENLVVSYEALRRLLAG